MTMISIVTSTSAQDLNNGGIGIFFACSAISVPMPGKT